MKHRIFVYVLFVFTFGCSENDSNTTDTQVEDGVFDAQSKAIEAIEGVEQKILDTAAKQRQAIDDQGG